MAENTSGPDTTPAAADAKNQGDDISADTFRQMVNILKDLREHTHQYYDDYTTVCQCQCACNRGTV